ncbi:transcription factor gte12 [Nicotiana attenuata]|uniref:Transcription factor gte12 n=1 Tax=Nicotiana attenuata TaxID=49451 RepID=A0A1J6I874_NICAT|nr:transcription factor gte12 [Nicotiana attenuata]
MHIFLLLNVYINHAGRVLNSEKMQRWKKKKDHSHSDSCTRASIKRKFHDVGDICISVSTKHKGVAEEEGEPHHENSSSKPTKLPEKRILELILDVLQRRDTHEIFAEPVDPTEVENYYEIIREPMDFGTMRAKLHEGMYQNLEQFEHDAFLISKNAMHFNSSGTVYFRQARAIYELAKKVFHLLKTNPGNFEVEFPGTRLRSMRRLKNEAKEKHSRGVIPDGALDDSSKNIGLGKSVSSTFRRSSKEGPSLTSGVAPIDSAFLLGNRHGQRLSSLDASRRSTYETCRPSSYHETNSFMCDKNPQSLILNRNGSYRESLMSFVKDLGPTAQMVANRKLQGNHSFLPSHTNISPNYGVQPPTCLGFAAFATIQSQSDTGVFTSSQKLSSPVGGFGSVLKRTSDKIDLTNAAREDETSKIGGMSSQKGPLPRTENSEKTILCYKRNVHKVTEEAAKKTQNGGKSKENNLSSHICTNGKSGDTNSSTMKKIGRSKVEEIKVLPVVLALEQSHSSLSELKWRNKKNSNSTSSRITRSQSKIAQSSPAQSNLTGTIPDQTQKNSFRSKTEKKAVICDKNENVGSSSGSNLSFLGPVSQSLKLELNKTMPVVPFPARTSSRFIFDMPFLKAQLNQMNPIGQNEMSEASRLHRDYRERSLYGQGSYYKMGREANQSLSLQEKPNILQTMPSFLYNNQSSYRSLAPVDTDLALQL